MVTQLLHRAGMVLGPAGDIMPPNASNPRGHFENNRFVQINDALLSHLGGTWDKPPELQSGWETEPSIGGHLDEARRLVSSFDEFPCWGWKDPRTSLLIPFWRKVVPEARFVLCVRNPLEVAESLLKRDGLPLDVGLALWERYMHDAVRETWSSDCIFTSYDRHFRQPEEEARRLLSFCGLPMPADTSLVGDVVDPQLKHQTATVDEWAATDDVPARVRLVYLIASDLALGVESEDIVRRLLDHADHVSGMSVAQLEVRVRDLGTQLHRAGLDAAKMARERDELLTQLSRLNALVVEQEAHLVNMVNTRSWKITAPMRRVFDCIEAVVSWQSRTRNRLALELSRIRTRSLHGDNSGVAAEKALDTLGPDSVEWQEFVRGQGAGIRFAVYASSVGNYFFREIRDLLVAGLNEAGFGAIACTEHDGFDTSADWHIVVAPHEFFHLGLGVKIWKEGCPRNLVLVNTEQTTTKWFSLAYKCFPASRVIWDISRDVAELIIRKNIAARYLALGYVSSFVPFGEVRTLRETPGTCYLPQSVRNESFLHGSIWSRPIDVLFVGGRTARREKFFAEAAPTLARYQSYLRLVDGSSPVVPGQTTDLDTSTVVGLEQRSKILLNIHRGSEKYFEWHRIVMHGIWQRALVISEPCSPAPPFRPGVDFVVAPLAEIPSRIEYYLETPEGRQDSEEMVDRAFRTLTENCRLADVLRSLIVQLPTESTQESAGISDVLYG